jgi:hypothetical protein
MNNEPWMVWSPSAESTRVMVRRGEEILLKAKLSPGPSHPRAAQWLMEAIALWEGAPVRGVISADGGGATYAKSFWDAVGMDFGGALYSLRLWGCEPRDSRQLSLLVDLVPELDAMDDLANVLVSEALLAGGAR